MIQEIEPHKYRVEFEPREPKNDDILLVFKGSNVLVRNEGGETLFPSAGSFALKESPVFLFGMDERAVYMAEADENAVFEGFEFVPPEYFREAKPQWAAFTGITAIQLHRWYSNNKFCSKCGGSLVHGSSERSLVCADCGRTIYPSISPCVIVAVTEGDRLLLTKYSPKHSKYSRYTLIAGYNEVGESLEDTVRREVMEEVGLRVKNIKYFKNQPWSFSDTLLVGFFCEIDGNNIPHIDENELSEAVWFGREELPECKSLISLTNTMIEHFRSGMR